jgi:hypothetical protein
MVTNINVSVNTDAPSPYEIDGGQKNYYQHTKAYTKTTGTAALSNDSIGSAPEIEHYNNYSKNGVPNNGIAKNNNGAQSDGMLTIDMRQQGETPEIFKRRFLNRYPQDLYNEWEVRQVFYNEDGIATTTHKRPPENLRVVLITNGPLGVRYELEVLSVSYNKHGVRNGFTSSPIDSAKRTENERFLRSEMDRINAIASQGVQDFIDGKIDNAEVSRIIEKIYNELVSLSIALGNTDGNDPKINAELLSVAQNIFSNHALNGAMSANLEEGREIAQERNVLCSWGHQRWVHYNARFFHANRELQEIGRAAIAQIAQNEGFVSFDVGANPGPPCNPNQCFNIAWESKAMSLGISRMTDTSIEPPKDFVMFFAADRFSTEERNNGTRQVVFASDPTRTDGHGSNTFHIWVPRGASLFREMPLWLNQGTHVSGDGESFVAWDITRHINFKAGDDMNSRLREFFAKHVNNFDKGELIIWSGGEKSVHDVPFCIFFDNRRGFQGSELTSAVNQNSFVKNFEFHLYNRRW